MDKILSPKGKFDLLFYYSQVSRNHKLQRFIENKEIATKIWIPKFGLSPSPGFFIRRGSKDSPLLIKELGSPQINEKFLELRSITKREEAIEEKKLTKVQEKVWLYFPPNKCIDFFYATNQEGPGKKIDRIFIDIDRTNLSSEKAQQISLELIQLIKTDKELNKIIIHRPIILWTGSSFHLYLMLSHPLSPELYIKHFSYRKDTPLESFIGRWAKIIQERTGIQVSGGHEKLNNIIIIDPSGTPSGKLARIPFSIHFKKPADKQEDSIDGVCVPLSQTMLEDKNLIKRLKSLTPRQVLEDLEQWAENL